MPVHRMDVPLKRSRRSGFTLVEILVVVGILLVLISILIPVVSKSRAQAQRVRCANNLRMLGQAVTAFEGEHNTNLPTCGLDKPVYPTSTDWIGWGGTGTTNGIDTTNKTDYINESGLAKYLGVSSPPQTSAPNDAVRRIYRCPTVSDDQRSKAIAANQYSFDYQFNAQLSGLPLDRITRASEKGMIVETDNRDDSAFVYWITGSFPSYHTGVDSLSARHGGQGDNCLFADGHVDVLVPTINGVATGPSSTIAGNFTLWDAYYTPAAASPATPAQEIQPQNASYGAAQ